MCDANVGSTIARALVAIGHDVVRATQVTPDADDSTILRYAADEDRVLITCDRDFGELVFLHGAQPPPGILYIRFEPQNVTDIVPRLVPLLDPTRLIGYITVIGTDQDRRTPFPAKSR